MELYYIMRFLKGDVKHSKVKSNRIIVVPISSHSTITDSKKRPGQVILKDGIYYMVTQYIEGAPNHYDTESERLTILRECIKNLLLMLSDINEIAIQHTFGSYTPEQWKARKVIWKELEPTYEILVYVII